MRIIIFTILAIALISFLIYKIKKSFSKKELLTFALVIIAIILASSYLTNKHANKLPNSFKEEYFKRYNTKIQKLSYAQTNVQVLSSTKEIYDFVYIISRNNQNYVCEASNVQAQLIEDEYVFKAFKEKCREK